MSTEQAAFDAATEAAIAKACVEHFKTHWRDHDYRACMCIGTEYFVKFNSQQVLWPEMATQQYIFEHALSQADTPGTPRIARIVHHFQDQNFTYLVMEYIKLIDSPPDLAERATEALKWLSRVPAPRDHAIGPLGSGPIRHSFFKDHEAPLRFSSAEALERYIAKAHTMLSSLAQQPVQPVKISHERLMFMQPDVDASNFGVDERGKTVLLDFEDIALLPESFAAYTASSSKNLAGSLGWLSSSPNVDSMVKISSCLWMMSDPTLGVDEDGHPKKKSGRH